MLGLTRLMLPELVSSLGKDTIIITHCVTVKLIKRAWGTRKCRCKLAIVITGFGSVSREEPVFSRVNGVGVSRACAGGDDVMV